jgi:Cft2 family RNA processing exonuclease
MLISAYERKVYCGGDLFKKQNILNGMKLDTYCLKVIFLELIFTEEVDASANDLSLLNWQKSQFSLTEL